MEDATVIGFHITRSKFHRDRIEKIFLENDELTSSEKDSLLASYKDWMDTKFDINRVFEEKYENSASKDGVVNKVGRYHRNKKCLYFSNAPEGAIAEAIYYLNKFSSPSKSDTHIDYVVLSAEICTDCKEISSLYHISDLKCDNHAVRDSVEQIVLTDSISAIIAPSARHISAMSYVVYNIGVIRKCSIAEEISIKYYPTRPSAIGQRSGGSEIEGFVKTEVMLSPF